MWTWRDSSPLSVPDLIWTFHFIGQTDYRFVRVSLRLAKRLHLAAYRKFSTLPEIRDYRDRLESPIQWSLGPLKHRIRDFALKYSRQLNLNRTKMAKSLENKLSRAMESAGGDSLAIDSARQDLECKASERYKVNVVKSRLREFLTKP